MLRGRTWKLLILLASTATASISYAAPSPGASGTLSLIPGLGQAANGDGWEGGAWFATTVGLFMSGNGFLRQIGWDLWMYNMYDAYRDAGATGADKSYAAVHFLQAYNPLNLIDPIGAPIVAVGAAAGARRGYPALRRPSKIITYGFVGMGEEGLFRGFLFPGFSDVTKSKWWEIGRASCRERV